MQTIVAPDSIAEKLKQTAREYLSKMQCGEYDDVWHRMITSEAAKLLSTALFPINIYKKGKIDDLLDSHVDGGFTVSFDEAIAYGFQTDMEHMRSGFFTGVATSMEPIGWYEATFGADSMAFVDSASGFVIWLGAATAEIQESPDTQTVKARLDYAVTQLLRKLPK